MANKKPDVDKALADVAAAIRKLREFALASNDPAVAIECQNKLTQLATKIFEINNEKLKANSEKYEPLIVRLNASSGKLTALKAGIDKTTKALSAAAQLLTALTSLVKAVG